MDVDYEKLFRSGQLVAAEPTHLEILHRYYQSFKGYPEEVIFKQYYRAFLEEHHPEDLVEHAVPSADAPPANPVDASHTPADGVPVGNGVSYDEALKAGIIPPEIAQSPESPANAPVGDQTPSEPSTTTPSDKTPPDATDEELAAADGSDPTPPTPPSNA